MKKLFALFIALALVSPAAFAEISIGGWARSAFVPLDYDTGNGGVNTPWVGTTWGGKGSLPRVARLQFGGANEEKTFGFDFWLQADGGADDGSNISPGFGDQANLWVQPWKWIALKIGKYEVDDLRGKVGMDTAFSPFVGGTEDANSIFPRFKAGDFQNALVSITPVDNLLIGVNFQNVGAGSSAADDPFDYAIAAGYKFGAVHVRAGYMDKGAEGAWDVNSVHAAIGFEKESFVIDAGVKIPLETPGFFRTGLGIRYSGDKLGVGTAAWFDIPDLGGTNNLSVGVYAEPTFNVGPVVLGIPLKLKLDTDTSAGHFGAGGYVKYPLKSGYGYIQTGLGATIPYGTGAAGTRLALPIIVEIGL